MGKTPDQDAAHPERRTVEIDSRVLTELAHWATIGLESGYETSKAMRIASLERARRESGAAFTLTDLHEASRKVRESAETVRETIEHLVRSEHLPRTAGHPSGSGDPHAEEGVCPGLPAIVVDAVCTATAIPSNRRRGAPKAPSSPVVSSAKSPTATATLGQ